MRKRTAKQTKLYRTTALAILRKCGAQVDEATHRMYILETRLGTLRISIWDTSIMCCFDDVARATAELGTSGDFLNPHSGKWNWMGGLNHEEDMADLEQFERGLLALMPESYTPNPDLPLADFH
ncbi:hypothetical protein [Pseudomonas sp. PLMAX]|jgi:hypothetical protein|uniref:hypothetical protein n=1 Tax=Pseudomonas sp. PLMAX TaxID=2201998 RepID=UPI0038BD2026